LFRAEGDPLIERASAVTSPAAVAVTTAIAAAAIITTTAGRMATTTPIAMTTLGRQYHRSGRSEQPGQGDSH
jgi:hypothetical protein